MATTVTEPVHTRSITIPAVTSKQQLHIRPARREDMPTIADFLRSSADWYRPFVDEKDMAEHDVDKSWEERNFKKRDFYVASLGQEPIGTVSLQYFRDYAYLGYVYLDVKHVSKGFGQKLLRHAESVARKRGARGLALIAHPKAGWAKRAYLKYGFHIEASRKQDVLAWRNGALEPYYEEGFELYTLPFTAKGAH